MSDTVKLIIEIPRKVKTAFDNAESNDLKGSYYDHDGIIGNAIKNGTPLPKGHGRLIDIDKALEVIACEWGYEGIEDDLECKVPTIIEADKAESEDKE